MKFPPPTLHPIEEKEIAKLTPEFVLSLAFLSQQWRRSPEDVIKRLNLWVKHNKILFEQNNDVITGKRTNLPVVIEKKEPTVLVKRPEPTPIPPLPEKKFQLTIPPLEPEVEKPKPKPAPAPKPIVVKPVPPPPPVPKPKEATPPPPPSKTSQTILPESEEEPPLKKTWSFGGRFLSIILYSVAAITIAASGTINVWFGGEMCPLPGSEVLCKVAGGSIDAGKALFLGVGTHLIVRGFWLKGSAVVAMWVPCLFVGVLAMLGFLAANQEHFVAENRSSVEINKDLRSQIEDYNTLIANKKGELDAGGLKFATRTKINGEIQNLIEEKKKISDKLRGEKHVTSENPVANYIMKVFNWFTQNRFGFNEGDINFSRSLFFVLCLELVAPISLMVAPAFWWEYERRKRNSIPRRLWRKWMRKLDKLVD